MKNTIDLYRYNERDIFYKWTIDNGIFYQKDGWYITFQNEEDLILFKLKFILDEKHNFSPQEILEKLGTLYRI